MFAGFPTRSYPIGARDNDWLRLTGDDQRQVQSVGWSVAMRRFLLVAVMCGAVTGAQAADMPDLPFLRGGITEGLNTRQGQLAGLLCRRPGRLWLQHLESFAHRQQRSASDLQPAARRRLRLATNLVPNAQSTPRGFGGFAGYNSQWDDVVLGIEANYIHDGIRSISDSSAGAVQSRPLVPKPDSFDSGREALRFRLACAFAAGMSWDASCLYALWLGKPASAVQLPS